MKHFLNLQIKKILVSQAFLLLEFLILDISIEVSVCICILEQFGNSYLIDSYEGRARFDLPCSIQEGVSVETRPLCAEQF